MAYNKETGMYEGFIYKIWNDVNDMFYIGRTYRTVEKRWSEHCKYSVDHNSDLYEAIREIGLEHFSISVIENLYSKTKDEIKNKCFEREKYWIRYYKDTNCVLYNMTDGGDDVFEKKYPERAVIQYDLFCNELARYSSIAEAEDVTGINHSDISECCLKRGKIYCTDNYIWRYIEEPLSDAEVLELNNRYKGVCQYDFDGKLLNTFYRPRDAALYMKENGINVDPGNITSCCNGKAGSCGNYIWRYREDGFSKYKLPKRVERVKQYTLDGDYVCTYDSCAGAERVTGIDSCTISQCCLKNLQKAGGFLWCYEKDNVNINIKNKEHAVDRYTLDKEYIDSYDSIAEASLKLQINRSAISSVCNNINKTAGGFIWRFKGEDISTYIYDNPLKNKKPVRTKPLMYNKRVEKRDPFTGELIAVFENEYEAAKSVVSDGFSAIHGCLVGDNRYIFKGYYFCYEGEYNEHFKEIDRYRNIDIYTLDGEYIKTVFGFYGCKEFLDNFSGNVGASVGDVCHGKRKSAYGYVWRFSGDKFDKEYNRKKSNGKRLKIVKYNLDGSFVELFNSAKSAAESVNTKNINAVKDCCDGFRDSYKDYIWKYYEEVKYA